MKKFIFIMFILSSVNAFSKQTINVGVYSFPPFVEINNEGQITGLTKELVGSLNRIQNEYEFKLYLTSPKLRYTDFKSGTFDLIFFENKKWGWSDYPVSASDVFLEGGEVYIANSAKGKNENYFLDLTDKKISVISGYHYGFANFNSDPVYLQKNFSIRFFRSHEDSINSVLLGVSDIAVVTRSYLDLYFKIKPEHKKLITVSNKMDQVYHHSILVRDDGVISKEKVNQLLQVLIKKNELGTLLDKYGIKN